MLNGRQTADHAVWPRLGQHTLIGGPGFDPGFPFRNVRELGRIDEVEPRGDVERKHHHDIGCGKRVSAEPGVFSQMVLGILNHGFTIDEGRQAR